MSDFHTIDLQPFCSKDRPKYMRPVSNQHHTFATDGIIMVKVDRRGDAVDYDLAASLDQFFERFPFQHQFAPAADAGIPELGPEPKTQQVRCFECDGRGKEHDCPECECICYECNGTGFITVDGKQSVGIRGEAFNARYVRLLLTLPGLLLPKTITRPDKDTIPPMPFAFDGGIGLLMPLRDKFAHHIGGKPVPQQHHPEGGG